MTEDQEKLQKELQLLRESFEADVITKEEYEREKQRLEQLIAIEPEKVELENKEESEEPIRINVESKKESEFREEERAEEKKESVSIFKIFLFFVLVLLVAGGFFFFAGNKEKATVINPACFSDADCEQEGKIGFCQKPGMEEAICMFEEDVKVNLVVINDKECGLCNSSRMEKVLEQLFPGIMIRAADSKDEEGRAIAQKHNLNALPSFIFDGNITKAHNFERFQRALKGVDDGFVVKNSASGAVYYFKREPKAGRLDAFVVENRGIDETMTKFLTLLQGNISYEKHIVTGNEGLVKELDITTYPAFLINNQYKVSGFLAAEEIKERFCSVNKIKGC